MDGMKTEYKNWREIASGAAPLDCAAVGFKCGIEIHQQVNTRKLFCECESVLRNEAPDGVFKRKLHAVASELGEYDPAALHEMHRERTFFYEYYDSSVCLVEMDEEPPHPVNRNALEAAMQVALLLNAKPVNEVQIMRKTVIDGSNTAGFQRTMLVATDGAVETSEGKSVVQYVSLEEDAARNISQTLSSVTYRLDRLGIPLIEIVTDPSLRSPRQAFETARLLGDVLRSTKVKRGLGTVRQDVSVSVSGGTRIEIKGVQTLELIPKIVENEARRQIALIGIASEIAKTGAPAPKFAELEKTAIKFAFPNLKHGETAFALRVPSAAPFIKLKVCPQRLLEQEFLDRCAVKAAEAKSFFEHSPEAQRAVGAQLLAELRAKTSCAPEDALFVSLGIERDAFIAVHSIAVRAEELFAGVAKETRRALEDGSTEYMRPLPGAARMYPETDVPQIPITASYVARVRASLPELRGKRIERWKREFGLERGEATEIMDAGYAAAFEESVKLGLAAKLVSNEILAFLRAVPEEKRLSEEDLLACLKALKEGKMPRESLQACLIEATKSSAAAAIQKLSAGGASANEVDETIRRVVAANPGKGFQALMGDVMRELRGKASGSEIAEKLKRALAK
jgi:glutamyl-tRNA(Gln) amidotransferase subunit E